MSREESIDQLRETLRILVRKLGCLQKSEAACCGITLSQCHAIIEIGRIGSISLNELADMLGLDRSTMSRTVDNLVNSNLAERETDPEDRRYVRIKLTAGGRELLNTINQSMDQYFRKIMESVPNDKLELVSEALKYLSAAIQNTDWLLPSTENCCQTGNKIR